MSKRNDAIAKLKAARNSLAEQITDLVLDADDMTNRFGDIDTILELGDRLHRLSITLINMPYEAEPPPALAVGAISSPPPTLRNYLDQVVAGEARRAVDTLSRLTGLTEHLARLCTGTFAENLCRDPKSEHALLSLRAHIYAGNGTALVTQLFGLPTKAAETVCDRLRETL